MAAVWGFAQSQWYFKPNVRTRIWQSGQDNMADMATLCTSLRNKQLSHFILTVWDTDRFHLLQLHHLIRHQAFLSSGSRPKKRFVCSVVFVMWQKCEPKLFLWSSSTCFCTLIEIYVYSLLLKMFWSVLFPLHRHAGEKHDFVSPSVFHCKDYK